MREASPYSKYRTVYPDVVGASGAQPSPIVQCPADVLRLRVRVSIFGTGGKNAYFSNQNGGAFPDKAATVVPDAFQLAVGSSDTLYLGPGETLYAMSDDSSVRVSVAAVQVVQWPT